MKRPKFRSVIKTLVILLVGILLGAILEYSRPVTLVSLSPNDRYQVQLIESNSFIDRNFELRLEDLENNSWTTLFRSPDVGGPIGSERIIWSRDSSRFVLLGRHFDSTRGVPLLENGEIVYLMYDIPSMRLWCNSVQQRDYPGFGMEEIDEFEWQSELPRVSEGEDF